MWILNPFCIVIVVGLPHKFGSTNTFGSVIPEFLDNIGFAILNGPTNFFEIMTVLILAILFDIVTGNFPLVFATCFGVANSLWNKFWCP